MTTRTKVTLYKTDFWCDHEDCPVSAEVGIVGITVNQDITEISGFISDELMGELAYMINAANAPCQYDEAMAAMQRRIERNQERKVGY